MQKALDILRVLLEFAVHFQNPFCPFKSLNISMTPKEFAYKYIWKDLPRQFAESNPKSIYTT